MYIVANALVSLLFCPVFATFWGVIVAPAAYALIHRIVSVQTRV